MSASAWMAQLAGRFIVFDGPDGSGKSTQFARFSTALTDAGVGFLTVREPGGTDIGERVRDILLDPIHDAMDLRCEMLLYMAARAQLVAQKIRPALEANRLVLADRYISSTLAYQGAAGGLDVAAIEATGHTATQGLSPDLTVIFDVDGETAGQRIGNEKDRMERKGDAYHARVRKGYLDQAAGAPDRIVVIDGMQPVDTVFASLCDHVQARLT